MEQKRLCPYCMGELPPAADSCVHCGKVFAGRNPAGCLPVGTVLAGRYTVGEMQSLDGEGILYRGVENLGCFRVTIKEYLPVTLSAERGADCILQPKTGSEVLFKTTRMDFADLYRALERITPATGLEAVLDVVEANNTVYAVMENLGGTPLDQWLEAQGAPLRPDDACAMLQPVFEGVAAMHKIGLVHRGICPENLRVMADGRCRLAGYATVGLRTAGSGLREQLYEGYSAPEQYSTAEFEGRYTDEYGLAAVFYRMVCGQAPVPAAQRMVSDSNPRARTVNSAVPGYVAGGLKDNAIPRESRAVIIVTDAAAAQAAISDMDAALRHECAAADPDVFVRSDAARPQQLPMDEASTQRAVCMLCCLPNGVQAMSRDIPGLVQTSLNLGILTTDANTVQASFCVRSSVATQKEMLVARLRCLMAQLGGTVTVSGDYPAWEYRKDSPLRERMVAVFREQYGRDPKVEAIHAGVECGLFAGKLPGLDCVSFGPDLTEIHTCRERMHIASVQRVWRYTLEVLRRCK